MPRYRTQLTQREISKIEQSTDPWVRTPTELDERVMNEMVRSDVPPTRDPARYYAWRRRQLDRV